MARVRKKFIKRNRIGIVFILVFVIYISLTLVRQEVKYRELKDQERDLQNEINKLNSEIDDLYEDVEYSESLDYIEQLAREKLKMIKPDEIIYIIKDDK